MSEAFELIKQRIEMVDSYHNTKERMAWIGSTFYYGLCLTVISVLLNNKIDLDVAQVITMIVGSVAVFIGAMMFINLQFTMRWHANDWTAAIYKVRDNYRKNYSVAKYVSELEKYNKECARKRCKSQILIVALFWPFLFWKIFKMDYEYRTEIPSYGIAFYLLLAKIALLINYIAKS